MYSTTVCLHRANESLPLLAVRLPWWHYLKKCLLKVRPPGGWHCGSCILSVYKHLRIIMMLLAAAAQQHWALMPL
jgi:hypothetical protein